MDVPGDSGGTTWMSQETVEGQHGCHRRQWRDNMDVLGDSGGTTWMSRETVEGQHGCHGR